MCRARPQTLCECSGGLGGFKVYCLYLFLLIWQAHLCQYKAREDKSHSQHLLPVRSPISVLVDAAGRISVRWELLKRRLLSDWVSRPNATVHTNTFTVSPWNTVFVRVHVMLLFIVMCHAEKDTVRPLLDLCVTNGVRYKCTMTGQNNTVLLGTAAATYNTAENKKCPGFYHFIF